MVNRSKRLFLLLFFCIVATPAFAQVPELIRDGDFREDAKAAVDSIYNFNFESADHSLASWKQQYPSHPLWTLIDGMKAWWHVLSDLKDSSRDEDFYEVMKQADYQAGKLLYENPGHADGLIIRAISNGYLARQHSNRSEWVTSLNYARKAMKAYDYLLEVQPELPDLKLAEGLKLYYSEYLPEAYPVVKTVSWFMPEGDKRKGLDLLQEASSKSVFAAAEASYFLGNINYNYEQNFSVAVRHFELLQHTYPRNNYYARILAKIYYHQGRYKKALEYIEAQLNRWEQEQLPFQQVLNVELLTWKGRILERKGADQQALNSYKAAARQGAGLSEHRHRPFLVIAEYSAGKLLFDQQQFEEAEKMLQQAAGAKAAESYQNRARELLAEIP